MLKPYVGRENKDNVIAEMLLNEIVTEATSDNVSSEFPHSNSEILSNLPEYLNHLSGREKYQLIDTVMEYKELFKNDSGHTNVTEHEVDMGDAHPIKQGPYRLNPNKNKIVNKEVEYMLDHDLVKASCSSWSSPVVLVKKGKR